MGYQATLARIIERLIVAESRSGTHVGTRLAAAASVLLVVALIAAQVIFTAEATGRTDPASYLDEASRTPGRFVASVALFTTLAFLVIPVFVALRSVLAPDRGLGMDIALSFAILGAGLSAAADAAQLALGLGTLPTWPDAEEAVRTALIVNAQSSLWFGDVLTDLSRLAFGLAVGAAALRMFSRPERVWRITGGIGLVAAAGSILGSFALALEALEIIWVVGLAALLLWFLASAAGLWRAARGT